MNILRENKDCIDKIGISIQTSSKRYGQFQYEQYGRNMRYSHPDRDYI